MQRTDGANRLKSGQKRTKIEKKNQKWNVQLKTSDHMFCAKSALSATSPETHG